MKIKSVKKVLLDSPKQFYDVINANPYNNFPIKTDSGYVMSHNCFFDEISFVPNQDVSKQKEKAKTLVNTAAARMQSRFMKGEHNPTLLVLASSKRTEQSYMETFIESKKKQESKTTLVVDEPQWVIRTDKDSPNKFKVAIGNKFLSSEVVPLNHTEQDLKLYRDRGYTLLDVPMGYYENFLDDIDIALTDIAGISTSNSNRYFAGPRVAAIKKDNMKNAFSRDVIEVGDGKEDKAQYKDFFNVDAIPAELKYKPLYIHMDMSVSGDKTGIAGVFIKGKRPPKEGQPSSKELFYSLGFSVSVKAPKGHQISFEKNRNFIYWLKEQGFNIKGISTDTFQSVDTGQQLAAKNFNYSVISVDRVGTDRICKPYQYLRTTIYEERFEMYDSQLLTDELIGLERDNNSGKIDHSQAGVNCFTGDTKVSLVDGRELSFKQLVNEYLEGKENFVYSFNHSTQKIEPNIIKSAWCSGTAKKLIKIELDNGEIIKCTPEHRFMLRDGSYCEAQYLNKDDSLMPLYRKYPSKGLANYRLYYEPMEDKWHYEHRQFAKTVDDKKYLVHHLDCNSKNNNPTNLIWMSKNKHILEHCRTQSGAQSKEANDKRKASIKKWHLKNKNNINYWKRYHPNCSGEEAYAIHLKIMQDVENYHDIRNKKIAQMEKLFGIDFNSLDHKSKLSYWSKYHNYLRGYDVFSNKQQKVKDKREDMSNYFSVEYDKLSDHEKRSLSIKYARISDPTYQEKVTKAVKENHKSGKYANAYEALQRCNEARKGKPRSKETLEKMKATKAAHGPYIVSEETRQKQSEITSRRRWYNNGEKSIYIDKDAKIPDGFKPGRLINWKNHKVKAIEVVYETEDVYDIEVENSNFALSSGVFVHNSKDSADAVCGAMWNASQHADEYAFEYGEDIEEMVNVSSGTSVDNDRKQINIDFEEELKRVLDPMQNFAKQNSNTQTSFMDFGFGKAQPMAEQYVSQGIIVF